MNHRQRNELKERAARFDAGEERLHSWDEVVADARKACGRSD